MLKESEILKRLATIKAVVLDMDGVLVDTEPLHMEAFARFLDQLKVPYDDQFLFSFIGYSVPDNIKKIYTEILNITDPQIIEQGIKQRDQIYLDLLNSSPLRPLAGIEELIAFCKQKNLDVALASSSDWEQIDTIFRNLSKTSGGSFEPQAIFKVVLSGQDVKNRKPDPEIYLKVCRLLEKEPQHCLTIEDSPAGVTSAVKAGLTCFALKSHFVEENKLHHAHAVINHIGQVTQWMKKVF
ncbi:MAG: HAD family phosphatase [Caldisericaceae bacterium]|nr:HAD family phosphatase [Caldisericaceae bacterium]